MKTAAEKRDPRQGASESDIRPEVHHPCSPERPTKGERHGQNSHKRQRPHNVDGIKECQNNQSECVVGNREQQEKWDCGVGGPEHPTRQEKAERNIGCRWDRPATLQVRQTRRPDERQVNRRRHNHPAKRGDDRRGRLGERMQGTTGRGCFDDLLRREGKEECHADFVDKEVRAIRH